MASVSRNNTHAWEPKAAQQSKEVGILDFSVSYIWLKRNIHFGEK